MLKIFGYDAVIFYHPHVGQGGLSTSIYIDQRDETRVSPSTATDIQRRADSAREIQLIYDPESTGSSKVDLFSKVPSTKPFAVNVSIYLKQTPVVGEIGNLQILSDVERLSDDPDRSHFDELGYRILGRPIVNFVMQRKLYSRPDGRPLFFFRRVISTRERIYTLTGSFLFGAHARVLYSFRTDTVPKENWIDIDKAVLEFVATILAPPPQQP